MTITYTPTGVCSRKMTIEVEEGIIRSVEVLDGCNGNLHGGHPLRAEEHVLPRPAGPGIEHSSVRRDFL